MESKPIRKKCLMGHLIEMKKEMLKLNTDGTRLNATCPICHKPISLTRVEASEIMGSDKGPLLEPMSGISSSVEEPIDAEAPCADEEPIQKTTPKDILISTIEESKLSAKDKLHLVEFVKLDSDWNPVKARGLFEKFGLTPYMAGVVTARFSAILELEEKKEESKIATKSEDGKDFGRRLDEPVRKWGGVVIPDRTVPEDPMRSMQAMPWVSAFIKAYIAAGPVRPKLIELKSDPEVFQMHYEGKKPFDYRSNADRVFNAGDIILEREFDRKTQMYSGREIVVRVLSMVVSPAYGLPDKTVILGFHPCMIKTEGNLKPVF